MERRGQSIGHSQGSLLHARADANQNLRFVSFIYSSALFFLFLCMCPVYLAPCVMVSPSPVRSVSGLVWSLGSNHARIHVHAHAQSCPAAGACVWRWPVRSTWRPIFFFSMRFVLLKRYSAFCLLRLPFCLRCVTVPAVCFCLILFLFAVPAARVDNAISQPTNHLDFPAMLWLESYLKV